MQKPQSPFFTISIVNDEEVIRFHDNDFRAFMYLNYRLFEDLLYRDGDSSVVKKEKDKNFLPFNDILNKIVVSVTSRYSHQLEDYVKDPLIEKILLSKRYSQVHEDEIDNSETSEDVRKKYLDLHEDHKASAVSLVFYATSCAYKDLLAAIEKFNKNEGLSAGEALHVFKHFARKETPLLICVNSGVNIVSKIFDVELRQYGMSQAIKYCHYVSLHNGNSFVSIGKTVYVPIWSGTMLPSEIGLSLPSEKDVSETLNRAEAYIDITKNGQKYLHYTGQMSYKQGWMVRKFNATGRVVVDYRGMKEMCPNYYSFFPFGGGSDDESNSVGTNTPTEVMKLNMSPYVYGFSLKNKHWGEFNVASFSPIVFRDDAYDKLVLDGGTKGLIRALVDSGMSSGPDLIDNKGGGCIFLLEGPPGVGKTLTAESVAETLHRPLYMVSVGELGTDTVDLEENLRRALDIATSWNAILLLDEADIFMEERSTMDVERNAMVSIFLRLLEYYQGIMFLTTNRAKNIDKAFVSRISLCIEYKDLSAKDREQVWYNILSLYGVDLELINIHSLASHDINGRQIKNVCRIAHAISVYKKISLTTNSYLDIIKMTSRD